MAQAIASVVIIASNSMALEDRIILLEEACILLQARVANLETEASLTHFIKVEDLQPFYAEVDRQNIME